MSGNAIDRRGVLAAGLGLLAAAVVPRPAGAAAALLVGARADASGRFFASGFDLAGHAAFDLPLPARGHGIALRPGRREAALFGRHPGRFVAILDLDAGRIVRTIANVPDRRFNGHGVFSADGALLFTTETDHAAERGVVGVYAAERGYAPVAAYDSGGLDPHDLRLLPDGRTLAIANGGIPTFRDAPRVKPNPADMDSSLAYLDARDGRLLGALRLPRALGPLGIRHLAVAGDGAVGFAAQYEGPSVDLVPLVGSHPAGAPELRLFAGPAEATRAMRNYCGSAAIDRGELILGVSSPRGNLATFWEMASGRMLATAAVADGCGIAPAEVPGAFVVASGLGGARRVDAATGAATAVPGGFVAVGRWDNHLLTIGG
ncbi:MAG: DUF1513 domain-containing protein [Alphaproteobacteria bacterium]|nr:DUF1513 domain-containing protein [Alphaproteobacteria bacterium]